MIELSNALQKFAAETQVHATTSKAIGSVISGPAPPGPTPEEASMPTVMVYHDIVKEPEHWLSSPKREEFFGPLGVTNIRTFVDPQNPRRVGLVLDIADLDAVMAAMDGPEAAEAMEYDGVVPESLVFLVER
jgi:hypothetical protein